MVTYLLTAATQPATTATPLLLPPEIWGAEALVKEYFTRPQPTLTHYDALLQHAAPAGQEVTR